MLSKLSLLPILIVAIFLLSGASESAELQQKPSKVDQSDPKKIETKTQTNSQKPPTAAPQSGTNESTSHTQNFNYSNYNYPSDSGSGGLAVWVQALANIAIAFLVGWQIWFFWGTMQATRDAAIAAKDAADIADQTLKTSERAWLSIRFNKPFKPQHGAVNPVVYSVKNTGKSAAFLKVKKLNAIQWQNSVIPERALDPKPTGEFPTIAVIFPNDELELEGLIDIDFTGDFFNQMIAGHKIFDVYGYVAYDDIFKVRHITRFCYAFNPGENINQDTGKFEFIRDPRAGYSDAD